LQLPIAAESSGSIIFDQAENRLHFQRALLKKLMA
jgi:ornithine carbamoyltransferase